MDSGGWMGGCKGDWCKGREGTWGWLRHVHGRPRVQGRGEVGLFLSYTFPLGPWLPGSTLLPPLAVTQLWGPQQEVPLAPGTFFSYLFPTRLHPTLLFSFWAIFFSYWPRPGVWEELRELGVSIFILSPLPPSPSTSFLTFCILPRLPGSSQKRAACPAWREREGGGSQGRLPEPWCPRPQPARSLLPGARPRPAAPVFSSGLIACQDLPNVSCSVSIFKRTPEAIFKQEGWGPMLMRGACSELTALPATSPAGVLGACTADPPPPSHTLWAWPAPGFIFKPGQTRALPRAKVYTHRLPLLGSSKLPGRDRSCHRYSLEPSMGPDREEGRVNICSSCARVSLLRCLTEASADGDASSLTPTSGWGVML